MSRRLRAVLAVALVLVALGGVAAGVRVADIGTPAAEPTVDTDQPPRAVIHDAGRVLSVMDHRLVTRVYVRDADTDGDRYHRATYRHVRSFTDRQHLAVYRTHRRILETDDRFVPTQFHSFGAFLHTGTVRRPGTSVVYATDGGIVSEFGIDGASTDPGAGVPAFEAPQRGASFELADSHEVFGDPFLPHDARWRVVDTTDESITYGIDDPYRQFEVRPTWGVGDIENGSRIRVTVDAATGRLERIEERRVLVYEDVVRTADGERAVDRRLDFRVVTEVDRYGTVDVDRPSGTNPTWQQVLADVLHY
ncbi:hypothetical protein [Haloglomus litoreum]|uniref:hypothetical protein n=1 Tax=Haloglomus litoreum TaxID=3034026 RepID=UPI0023E7574F|nr:hypothetical protein [Haloglomus sp. DT116]